MTSNSEKVCKGDLSLGSGCKRCARCAQQFEARIAELEATCAAHEAAKGGMELAGWRTFDGEGGYFYRGYEHNESYLDDWNRGNPKHKGWVEPMFVASKEAQ